MIKKLYQLSKQRPVVTVGVGLIIILILLALCAPLIAPSNPNKQSLPARNKPPGWVDNRGSHLFGTDPLGRDVLSRVLFGLRISLLVGLGAVSIAGITGTVLGVLTGYLGGKLDTFIMRLVDLQLSVPYILFALILVAIFGANLINIIIVVALRGWVSFSRIIRGQVLSIKQESYIEATKALGSSTPRILVKHILPQIVSQAVIVGTFQVGKAILLEAGLGFLGLSIPPPTPTLGGILSNGRDYMTTASWLVIFPGLTIMLIVLAVNITSDRLRDTLDPYLK